MSPSANAIFFSSCTSTQLGFPWLVSDPTSTEKCASSTGTCVTKLSEPDEQSRSSPQSTIVMNFGVAGRATYSEKKMLNKTWRDRLLHWPPQPTSASPAAGLVPSRVGPSIVTPALRAVKLQVDEVSKSSIGFPATSRSAPTTDERRWYEKPSCSAWKLPSACGRAANAGEKISRFPMNSQRSQNAATVDPSAVWTDASDEEVGTRIAPAVVTTSMYRPEPSPACTTSLNASISVALVLASAPWLGLENVGRNTGGSVSWTGGTIPGENTQVLALHDPEASRAILGLDPGHARPLMVRRELWPVATEKTCWLKISRGTVSTPPATTSKSCRGTTTLAGSTSH
mmetsp:Transcript_9610/g.22953  ORF Transcript_9610/g.22953 Transcript_9610/m.22953 type:complete len:342 (-) Transcript_9610:738-1763(-)